MMLCHRVVGSDKEAIYGRDSEVAFKSLAVSLLVSSIFTRSSVLFLFWPSVSSQGTPVRVTKR